MRTLQIVVFSFILPLIVKGQIENKVFKNELFAIKFEQNQKCEKIKYYNDKKTDTIVGNWNLNDTILSIIYSDNKTIEYILSPNKTLLTLAGEEVFNDYNRIATQLHLTEEDYDNGVVKIKYFYKFKKNIGYILKRTETYTNDGKLCNALRK